MVRIYFYACVTMVTDTYLIVSFIQLEAPQSKKIDISSYKLVF